MTMKKTKKLGIRLPRSIKRLFPQVEHAFDSADAVEISVNKNDCKNATKLNPAECALARAAKREFQADGVIVGISTSYIIKGKEAMRFSTPESVSREIISFDRHHDFAPGEYYLRPKSASQRFGENTHKGGGKNKTARRKVHNSARVRILAKGTER